MFKYMKELNDSEHHIHHKIEVPSQGKLAGIHDALHYFMTPISRFRGVCYNLRILKRQVDSPLPKQLSRREGMSQFVFVFKMRAVMRL